MMPSFLVWAPFHFQWVLPRRIMQIYIYHQVLFGLGKKIHLLNMFIVYKLIWGKKT